MALLGGRLAVTEIIIVKPRFNIVMWNEEKWNFQELLLHRPPEFRGPKSRPIVRLDEGTVTVKRKVDGKTTYSQTLELIGLLLPAPSDRDAFTFQADIAFRQLGPAGPRSANAFGRVNLKTGEIQVEIRVANISFSEGLRAALPAEAGSHWDLFQPSGSVDLKAGFNNTTGFYAVADLMGAGFKYVHRGVTLNLQNLAGQCRFTPQGIEFHNVRGLLNATAVTVDGRIDGFDMKRAAMDVRITAVDADVASNRELSCAFSPKLTRIYDTYHPEGRIDLMMTVRREPDSGRAKPVVKGSVVLKDGKMLRTPRGHYITDLSAQVDFGPGKIDIKKMSGMHGSSKVTIEGTILSSGTQRKQDLRISAKGIYLDEDFGLLFGPRSRRYYDEYHPRGLADVKIHVFNSKDSDKRTVADVLFDLRDVEVYYDNFPYKVKHISGRVHITPEKTTIEAVKGRHGDAVIQIDGTVTRHKGTPPIIDLTIAAHNVPLDADLEAALDKNMRKYYRMFHPSGRGRVVNGRIYRNADTDWRLAYELPVEIEEAHIVYDLFPYPVEKVSGKLMLRPGHIEIKALRGQNGGARLTATGWAKVTQKGFACDISLTGTDVQLKDDLHNALTGQAHHAWTALAPKGVADITARLTQEAGKDSTLQQKILIKARDASAMFDGFPYPVKDLNGEITVESGLVKFEKLTCRNGGARLIISGSANFLDKSMEVELRVKARKLPLDDQLKRALPKRFQKVWEQLKPFGTADVDIKQFRYKSQTGDGGKGKERYVARWEAEATLDGAGFAGPMSMEVSAGKLFIRGRDDNGKLQFEGKLHSYKGKVAGMALDEAVSSFSMQADSPNIAIRSVEAMFYGGRVTGFGMVNLDTAQDGTTSFALNLSVADVDLPLLLTKGFHFEQDVESGRLKGRVVIRSAAPRHDEEADAPPAIEAMGDFHVTDAKLYRLPVVLGILNLMQLTSGEQKAFREISAKFFLRRGRFVFEDIRVAGRGLNLYGAGSLEPEGQLRLSFLTGRKQTKRFAPILHELLEGLRKELIVVEVVGTLQKPQIRRRTLKGITGPMRELLNLIREQRRSQSNSKKDNAH
ncbi:MAG: hypothetical protein QGD94_00520, partial [Planctomycetia bacterium]|nr:hypothetical protein [Planctomycetia bacterium]